MSENQEFNNHIEERIEEIRGNISNANFKTVQGNIQLTQFLEIIVVIVFPLLGAAALALVLDNPSTVSYWLFLAVVVFLHILLGFFLLRQNMQFRELAQVANMSLIDTALKEISEELFQQDKDIDDVLGLVDHYSKKLNMVEAQAVVTKAAIAFLRGYLTDDNSRGETYKEVDKLLQPLVAYIHDVFGIEDPNSIWSVALYLYSKDDNLLHVFCRRHHPRLEPLNRSWSPGDGHVGFTFKRDAITFLSDIRNEGMAAADARHEVRDSRYYKSFISIPLSSPRAEEVDENKVKYDVPYGVLAITSSEAGQFDRFDITNSDGERVEFFKPFGRVYGLLLSTYVSLHHDQMIEQLKIMRKENENV